MCTILAACNVKHHRNFIQAAREQAGGSQTMSVKELLVCHNLMVGYRAVVEAAISVVSIAANCADDIISTRKKP